MIVIEYDNAKDKFYFTKNNELLNTIYREYSAIEYLQTLVDFSYDLSKSYIYEAMNNSQKILA